MAPKKLFRLMIEHVKANVVEDTDNKETVDVTHMPEQSPEESMRRLQSVYNGHGGVIEYNK